MTTAFLFATKKNLFIFQKHLIGDDTSLYEISCNLA